MGLILLVMANTATSVKAESCKRDGCVASSKYYITLYSIGVSCDKNMSDTEQPGVDMGCNCDIAEMAVLNKGDGGVTTIGDDATIRDGTIIYGDVTIGHRFATGHHALVRSGTTIGNDTIVGTHTILDGELTVGSRVSLQSGVYLPPETTVADDVFFGPHAVVTNDPYPVRETSQIVGATFESNVSIGANATVLPGVAVGQGSFVAAGSVVTEDVPPETLAIGVPATHKPLPTALQGANQIG